MATVRQGDPTRYEIVMKHPDGRRLLVGYTTGARGNLHALLSIARQNDAKIGTAMCDLANGDKFAQVNPKRRADGYLIGEWTVIWSGRTKRDAAVSELPWVVDEAAKAVA